MGEITFEDLIQFGRDNGATIVKGMPWSFTFCGLPISHERDDLYLIAVPNGESLKISPGQYLSVAEEVRVFDVHPKNTAGEIITLLREKGVKNIGLIAAEDIKSGSPVFLSNGYVYLLTK